MNKKKEEQSSVWRLIEYPIEYVMVMYGIFYELIMGMFSSNPQLSQSCQPTKKSGGG